ncbi:MAG: hypothetical protein PHV68_07970 [Candidatus Gastranaerophilales bacterium]|nr:hypothetical protein [Candidatus Gastranaerophilales bacterium]
MFIKTFNYNLIMSSYTVRIELDSNVYSDFEVLHNAMKVNGFKKTIISSDGIEYYLPRAEYDISTLKDRSIVLDLAKDAVIKTGKKAEILVTESNGRTWSGLKLVNI